MMHLVARTVRHRLLFTSWTEGLQVWRVVLRAVPKPLGLCLMPDHLHVLADDDVRHRLAQALAGLARSRGGQWFEPLPAAEPVVGRKKQRRALRYVHLNPCRAGLVQDPLAWPLSTHRDAVGLTAQRVGMAQRAEAFHRYVSSDPTACVVGTELPAGMVGAPLPFDVLVAVAAVYRVPLQRLSKHVEARGAAVRALAEAGCSQRAVAAMLGVSRSTVQATPDAPLDEVRKVRRVLGDPRFGPLDDASLLEDAAWRRYRRRG